MYVNVACRKLELNHRQQILVDKGGVCRLKVVPALSDYFLSIQVQYVNTMAVKNIDGVMNVSGHGW